MSRGRGWAARAAALGVTLLFLALAWSLLEPRILLDVEEVEVVLPDLPPELSGLRIAHLSDPQLGIFLDNDGTFRRAVRRIVRERPDLVLLGGDYVYRGADHPAAELRRVVGILRPIVDAGLPTYAVLGNHDVDTGPEDRGRRGPPGRSVRRALEAIGIRVLHDEAVPVRPRPGAPPLWIVGLAPREAVGARPDVALAGVPRAAPRIVLVHDPLVFRRLPAGAAPLALAGHTHGGQVRVPLTPGWNWLTLTERFPAAAVAEWADAGFGAAGNRLYVNRGIGFSGLPIRFNCPPHLPFLILRSGPPPAGSPSAQRPPAEPGSARAGLR